MLTLAYVFEFKLYIKETVAAFDVALEKNKMNVQQLSALFQSELSRIGERISQQIILKEEEEEEEEEGNSTFPLASVEKQTEKNGLDLIREAYASSEESEHEHVANAMDVDEDAVEVMDVDEDEDDSMDVDVDEDEGMDVNEDQDDDDEDDDDDDDDDGLLKLLHAYIKGRQLKKHRAKSTAARRKYHCPKCKKTFPLKHKMWNHTAFCKDGTKTKCQYCSKELSTPYNKKRHEAVCKVRGDVIPGQVRFECYYDFNFILFVA